MNGIQACERCGSQNLLPGAMHGIRETRFVPEKPRFITVAQTAAISATACMDCGALSLSVNPADLHSLIKDEGSGTE